MTQDMVPITHEMVAATKTTRMTLINWLLNYTLKDGRPLGKKIGGRWRVWPDRLQEFITEGGQKIGG